MKPAHLGVAALLGILAIAAVGAYLEWTGMDTAMPTTGWVTLIAGVVVSVLLGVGLMALMFYSSRRGWDDEAQNGGFLHDDDHGEHPDADPRQRP
jgi:hypothetical protein